MNEITTKMTVFSISLLYLLFFQPTAISQQLTLESWEIAPKHLNGSTASCFSSDSRTFAIATSNYKIVLYDVEAGKELRTMPGHFHYIDALAFNPDGALLASGSRDITIKIWSATTGKIVTTLSGHLGGITTLKFSPNGKFLISGSTDRTVRIWDVAKSKQMKVIRHKDEIREVFFSSNGYLLATRGLNLKVWKFKTDGSVGIATNQVKDAQFHFDRGRENKGNGKYDVAITQFKESVRLNPDLTQSYYNLACIYSLKAQQGADHGKKQKQIEENLIKAINNLTWAIEKGYKDWSRLQKDAELDFLRVDPRYQRLSTAHIPKQEKKQTTGNPDGPRRISFYVMNTNGLSVPAHEILVNNEKITTDSEFAPELEYDFVLRFKTHKTLQKRIKIDKGVGPFVIQEPLRRLNRYKFFVRGTGEVLDGIKYDYELYTDSVAIEPHLIKVRKKGLYTYYTLHADISVRYLQAYAGFMYGQKRLFQLNNNKGIKRLDKISIPRLTQHLDKLSEKSGNIASLVALEKMLKSLYSRKKFRNNSGKDIMKLYDYVEKLDFYDSDFQTRRELLLEVIQELMR